MKLRCRKSVRTVRVGWLAMSVAGLGLVGALRAEAADMCNSSYTPAQSRHPGQNVVLIVLDDVSASEFPGLNLPIRWAEPNTPDAGNVKEAGIRRPDLNRLAARAFSKNGDFGAFNRDPREGATPQTSLVVPYDLKASGAAITTSESPFYLNGSTEASRHSLLGAGGLGRLATEGLGYARHYAPSGRCAPTRASLFTGRNNLEVGVVDNGSPLGISQITIADFLKGRGYTTGLIGKWHMRNGDDKSCWQRGFDETLHYEASSRKSWKENPLLCSPLHQVVDGTPTPLLFVTAKYGNGTCASDANCETLDAAHCGSGLCACAPGPKVGDPADVRFGGYCYLKQPASCTVATPTCRPWGRYLGAEPTTVRVGCHPDDLDNPLCCVPNTADGPLQANSYFFTQKVRATTTANNVTKAKSFWRADQVQQTPDSARPCYYDDKSPFDAVVGSGISDSGNTQGGAGCRYDTRYFRDAAKNFILRNASKPFFLYLAPHGLHNPSAAPLRVEAHYSTPNAVGGAAAKPRAPMDGPGYWGALEEVDAAIGQILSTLDTTYACSGGTAVTTFAPCSGTGGACPGGGTCRPLSSRTLVMLTADQGRPGSGFGEPMRKGGKGSVSEGGVSVGLHVWSGANNDLGIGHTLPSDLQTEVDAGMSMHADLFATIAHASGCKPDTEFGQYKVSVCDDGERKQCTTSGECATNVACVANRLISGRSLLPKLSVKVKDYNEGPSSTPLKPRNFAFVSYMGAGKAIIARKGMSFVNSTVNFGVCGRVDEADAGSSSGSNYVPIDRMRRAGSKEYCDLSTGSAAANSYCAGRGAAACVSMGKYCVPTSNSQTLSGCLDGSVCDWAGYPRCRGPKDCAGDAKCTAVRKPCDTCYQASFKLRTGGGDKTNVVNKAQDLFDLTTNPEELEDLNLASGVDVPTGAFAVVEKELKSRLGGWSDCVKNKDNSDEVTDCETCFETTSGTCGTTLQ